ncbi:hypothetical protein [Caballeronia telluris]|uniref:hypothetical protein n=1 Tax=Caballeronia telluris TaxID=326475 RepID=UPI000F73E9C4|nr:hypothetical protein [Caballeronia telluris]
MLFLTSLFPLVQSFNEEIQNARSERTGRNGAPQNEGNFEDAFAELSRFEVRSRGQMSRIGVMTPGMIAVMAPV